MAISTMVYYHTPFGPGEWLNKKEAHRRKDADEKLCTPEQLRDTPPRIDFERPDYTGPASYYPGEEPGGVPEVKNRP